MSITLIELANSRNVTVSSTDAKITFRFLAQGSMDEGEILQETFNQTPPVYAGLIRSEVNISPFEGLDGAWEVIVTYKPTSTAGTDQPLGSDGGGGGGDGGGGGGPPEIAGPSFSVDLVGDTVKITQSLRTTGNVAPGPPLAFGANLQVVADKTVRPDQFVNDGIVGGTLFVVAGPRGWRVGGYGIVNVDVNAQLIGLEETPAPIGANNGVWIVPNFGPNYRRAIGVTENSVEGCDVYVPRFEWSITYQVPTLPWNYLMTVWSLVGRKNAKPFYGAQPGEVLYLGMTGSYSVRDAWSLTHKFSVIPNEYNFSVAPDIKIPVKRGWDYLWTRYKRVEEDGVVLHVAAVAYTEEVIPDGDFSLLGIGG